MSLDHVLILVGLAVEITGAFILAADAIGLARLAAWAADLREVRGAVTGEKPWARSTFLDPNRFISAIGAGGGVIIGAKWLDPMFSGHSRWVAVPLSALIAAIVGIFVALVLTRVMIIIIQLIASSLLRLESRVRVHATGVLGFGLLFLGFALQFAGTLMDGLRRG